MKQKVRIQIDVTIEVDAKYARSGGLAQLVERNARLAFKNNARSFEVVRYTEAADTNPKSTPSQHVWVDVIPHNYGLARDLN